MWWEPRWLQVQAQEYLQQRNLPAARIASASASALRPHDPELYKLVAEVLAQGGAFDKADLVAQHALQIDPRNPELRVLRSTVLLQQQRYDEAIAAVVTDPHPVLRSELAAHFRALARLAEQRGDATGAARCAVERDFLLAVDALGDTSANGLLAADDRRRALWQSVQAAGLVRKDLRALTVAALQFLDLDKPDAARDLGVQAKQLGITMPPWQRALFGDKLARLLEQEVWFDVLRSR
jgi:tetratricopeptide (TPR) repeat protein